MTTGLEPWERRWETTFRVVDVRFAPFWGSSRQPEGRWHAAGQGPCHYLATSPEGAWAEVLRHEALRDPEDVADLHRSLWSVFTPMPDHDACPDVPETRSLARVSYRQCQEAAMALRAAGHESLMAGSAALPKAGVRVQSVDDAGRLQTEPGSTHVVAVFGPATQQHLQAQHCADGHPDPSLTERVHHLPKKGTR